MTTAHRLHAACAWCAQRLWLPPATPTPEVWTPLPEPSPTEVTFHREAQQASGGPLTHFEALLMMLTEARLTYTAYQAGELRQVIEIATASKHVVICELSGQGRLVSLEIEGAG